MGDKAEESEGCDFIKDAVMEVAEEEVGRGIFDPHPQAVSGKIIDRGFTQFADGGADPVFHGRLRNIEAFPPCQPGPKVEVGILVVQEKICV